MLAAIQTTVRKLLGQETEPQAGQEQASRGEEFYRASRWQLVWWKFKQHTLARLALTVLAILYFCGAFAGFVAPYKPLHRFKEYTACPPTIVHIYHPQQGFKWPFVYGKTKQRDPETARLVYTRDLEATYPINLFVRGDPYKLIGLFETDIHLFGTRGEDAIPPFLLGTDRLGRDVLSRVFHGARISLSIGLAGVSLSFIIGLVLGGIAGYFGGVIDKIVMRVIDVIRSMPTIPLWMALAAALPQDWPQLRIYFGITIVLSFVGWTNLARIVRGKLLSLREEDFAIAARLDGESDWAIIAKYLLPNFTSYLIVSLTMAIPNMILGETSLSFLGIGLNPPAVSWGVMLQDAQKIMVVAQLPWVLYPAAFVIVAVLMFNFLGDGLRDAADPYKTI